jgi:outer membrane protein
MRNLFGATFILSGLMALAAPVSGQAQKIAYLDSRRIIATAPGAQDARASIEQEMQKYQAQVKVLSDSLDAIVADYQKKSVLLSPDEKSKQEQATLQKRAALQQRAQDLEDQATKRQNDLMQPVMDRIEKVIDEVRKEGGYAVVFDLASGSMVSADTTLDLTTRVMDRLKAAASAPTAKNK